MIIYKIKKPQYAIGARNNLTSLAKTRSGNQIEDPITNRPKKKNKDPIMKAMQNLQNKLMHQRNKKLKIAWCRRDLARVELVKKTSF